MKADSAAAGDLAEHLGEVISPLSGGRVPRHVGIIMDGNGRWANQRGLPRAAGHRAGTENIRRIIERFTDHGIQHLTLYAFSTENWSRPRAEVRGLIRLLSYFIKREVDNFVKSGVRLRMFGHKENLPDWLQRQIDDALERTKNCDKLSLNICFSYGGRDDVVGAVRQLIADGVSEEDVTEEAIASRLYSAGQPDPDLIIRTAGDQRISNFLIWQASYAELYFTDTFWPDFGREDVDLALADYGRRKRKFGGLPDDLGDSPDALADPVD